MRKITLVCALALVAGCSLLLGKSYERMDPVPGGMAVIYIYPAKTNALQTVLVDKDAQTDGVTESVKMVKKGYFPYLTQPGLMRVLSGSESNPSCVMLAVTAGSSHYVRVQEKHPRVTVVEQKEAEQEMGSFREISREALGPASGTYKAEECPMIGEQF